ncbi:MAG: hypothetical protein EON93_07835 [Burkholderiales bacterium]|nr:MAG: hypothetical protein EON93_07835 [Burkholderiales bacterium]
MPGGTRFIVCGPSGSGKSRAIDLANQALPEDEQITESGELRSIVAPEEAAAVVDDRYLAYENSQHIGFSVWRKERGMAFERHGLKVFWLV